MLQHNSISFINLLWVVEKDVSQLVMNTREHCKKLILPCSLSSPSLQPYWQDMYAKRKLQLRGGAFIYFHFAKSYTHSVSNWLRPHFSRHWYASKSDYFDSSWSNSSCYSMTMCPSSFTKKMTKFMFLKWKKKYIICYDFV